MATYFIGSESPAASGGSGGGSSNNFLRGLSQLAESDGRGRYYDYLMGAPARDEAKYNRAKADGRENYRLNLWGDSRAEHARNIEREKEYNFITSQRELNQKEMSQTGLALEGMGVNPALLAQGGRPSEITNDWANEEGADVTERMAQKSLVARLLGELDAQTKNEESHLKTLRSNPSVLQDPYGRPFGFSPTRLTRDQYTKEFGVDPFTGEAPQEQTREESPASVPSQEETSPPVGGFRPSGYGEFGGPSALAAPPSIQSLSPADQAEEQRIQEMGRLGEERRAENREASPLDLSREILYGDSAEPSWYQSDIPTSQLIPSALSQLAEERDGLAGRISSLESPTTSSVQPYTGMYGGPTPQTVISEKGDFQQRSDMAEASELRNQLEGIDFNIERLSPEPTITQDAADTGVTVGSNMPRPSLPIELSLDQRLNPQSYPSLNRDTSAGPMSNSEFYPPTGEEISRTVLPEYLSGGYEGYEMGDGNMSGRISPEEMPTEIQLPPPPPGLQYSERAPEDLPNYPVEDNPDYMASNSAGPMELAALEEQQAIEEEQLAIEDRKRAIYMEGLLQQQESLREEGDVWSDYDDTIDNKTTATWVLSYIDAVTGTGISRKLLKTYGWDFVKGLVGKSAKEITERVAEFRVKKHAARESFLKNTTGKFDERVDSFKGPVTGSGPLNPGAPPALQYGNATKGMSGRFVNRPGMERVNPMMNTPTPASMPRP